MNPPEDLRRENRALRQRLALLNQASLSINESLDSARSLTRARYGVIARPDAGCFSHDAGAAVAGIRSGGMVTPCCDGAPAHGVALVTGWSVKLGAYSQTTFRMARSSGLS